LDIEDSRIAIAVGDTQEWSNRIAGLSHTSSELRESTATYLTSGQKDLDGLRQAVDRRACDIDEATTELARDSLRIGALLSKASTDMPARGVSAETAFASDDPTAWIAALGAMSLAPTPRSPVSRQAIRTRR
jgi:hypothetical protein